MIRGTGGGARPIDGGDVGPIDTTAFAPRRVGAPVDGGGYTGPIARPIMVPITDGLVPVQWTPPAAAGDLGAGVGVRPVNEGGVTTGGTPAPPHQPVATPIIGQIGDVLSGLTGSGSGSSSTRTTEPIARSTDTPLPIVGPAPLPPNPMPDYQPIPPPTVTGSGSPGNTATPPTATSSAPGQGTDPLTTALVAALTGGNGSGVISGDMAAGVPSTAGLQAIVPTAAPSTTTSNPAVAALVVVAIAGGVVFAIVQWRKHHKGASSTAPSPEHGSGG